VHGCAIPANVSEHAKARQRDEMGTLGSGNHYLEVQKVATIFDPETAAAFPSSSGDVVLSIHCGSRGLGHQIGTEVPQEDGPAGTLLRVETAGSRTGVRSHRFGPRP
jgi:tRNA-splicing ligase RtcB